MSEKPVWLSAGIVPVFKGPEPRYLLLRVFKYWDFPKGLVEKGEDPMVAAKRELREETGIAAVAFPWGKEFIETDPYRGGKVARYYLGEVRTKEVVFGINPELGHAEHHEYRWATKSEAEKLLSPRVSAILQWAAEKIQDRST